MCSFATGAGSFRYVEVIGAFADEHALEIAFVGGRRLRIMERHFLDRAKYGLAWFLDDVAGVVFGRPAPEEDDGEDPA